MAGQGRHIVELRRGDDVGGDPRDSRWRTGSHADRTEDTDVEALERAADLRQLLGRGPLLAGDDGSLGVARDEPRLGSAEQRRRVHDDVVVSGVAEGDEQRIDRSGPHEPNAVARRPAAGDDVQRRDPRDGRRAQAHGGAGLRLVECLREARLRVDAERVGERRRRQVGRQREGLLARLGQRPREPRRDHRGRLVAGGARDHDDMPVARRKREQDRTQERADGLVGCSGDVRAVAVAVVVVGPATRQAAQAGRRATRKRLHAPHARRRREHRQHRHAREPLDRATFSRRRAQPLAQDDREDRHEERGEEGDGGVAERPRRVGGRWRPSPLGELQVVAGVGLVDDQLAQP